MDDRRIVELYWERDEQAIPATSTKYGAYCTAIAKNILGSREDAEECVNDTYLNAWNAMPPHKPDILPAFLGKITRNLSFNRYKHNTAEKRGGGQLPLVLDELRECITGEESAEEALDRQELTAAMESFLNTLPAEKRNLFVSRYWYTESISDMAARFGMKESAVAMTLSRTRKKLRDYLTERGF